MIKIRTGKQGFENFQSAWGQANLATLFLITTLVPPLIYNYISLIRLIHSVWILPMEDQQKLLLISALNSISISF